MLPRSGLPDGKALLQRNAADASNETLVEGARAVHLPSTPPARFAHPHPT
jgi:hypothetical protein